MPVWQGSPNSHRESGAGSPAKGALNSTFQGAGTATPVHVPVPRTPVNNVNLRGASAATPINVSPQAPLNSTFQGAGTATPVFQGAGTATPVHNSAQGAGSRAVVKVSTRGAKSNDEWPTCKCTAGKCKILEVTSEDCYVCPIPKGQGKCTQNVPVHAYAAANKLLQTGDDNTRGGDKDLKDKPAEKEAHGNNLVQVADNNANGSVNPAQPEDSEWPFDIVNKDVVPTPQPTPQAAVRQGSPIIMLHQPIAMVEKTPTKLPMTPNSTRSPMTPRSDSICFGCGEKGHWIKECPKPSPKNCFHCGMSGHWRSNCPQLQGS